MSFPSRIGEPAGNTSPEELMAASHASCYAMALNATVGRKGGSIGHTLVTATIVADKGDAGIKLTTSKLKVVAENLQGIEKAQFNEVAREAESKCPISNALRGSLQIELETEVEVDASAQPLDKILMRPGGQEDPDRRNLAASRFGTAGVLGSRRSRHSGSVQ